MPRFSPKIKQRNITNNKDDLFFKKNSNLIYAGN